MAQNAQNCSIQREMQKQPKNFKKCQVGEAASIWPLKASKLEIYARFYLTKLVSKYIHDRIIYKKKWCHSTIQWGTQGEKKGYKKLPESPAEFYDLLHTSI